MFVESVLQFPTVCASFQCKAAVSVTTLCVKLIQLCLALYDGLTGVADGCLDVGNHICTWYMGTWT